ncbi:RNA-binding protein involved in heterochromatin assembly dri1-like isoform X2 [Impatiens glandulifera]|uniref:RNA-binding protein involved in heterochromatin assembly dri1-like isoform X2 n=1 Tax=Impatiens glandulifera TaxID=253017 RepID=UPI001FB0BC44|nr:RNA-binding protein involved in heterochromatin assembly dri1-like isoform X2 [Impatiens glandulifera]
MSREGGEWMCGSCRNINFKKRDNCNRCQCPKFSSEGQLQAYAMPRSNDILPGDWYCNIINCGAHNYASRINCYKCGGMRDDGYCSYSFDCNSLPGWKTGDWMCARFGCSAHNYAHRIDCFKCQTPRQSS